MLRGGRAREKAGDTSPEKHDEKDDIDSGRA